MDLKTLTVIDHGEQPGDTARVTFQPMNIAFIRAGETLVQRQGTNLYRVLVKLIDGEAEEIHVNSSDLHTLEEAIGMYVMEV